MMYTSRKRLDQLLVERGFFTFRAKACVAIKRGSVLVNGKPTIKVSQAVNEHSEIIIDHTAHLWVSRGALKLEHALKCFAIEPADLICLDIGASTGGFTQVLLMHGAQHVFAVDVGHNQIDAGLARDPRVSLLEKLNAKDLTIEHLTGRNADLIVADVSFISLIKVLPSALALAVPGARLIALIKPQFEVGPRKVKKGGIVRDTYLHTKVCHDIAAWIASQGDWHVIDIIASPIEGRDGNKEFLIAALCH
jgi:23S rRNA (cytidine1920-2'-O)/16S rRNA (cytidine1409-2'-O)-methyltransferase